MSSIDFNSKYLINTPKRFGKVILLIFCVFQLYILTRLYLFASCVIPTYSMSPTLQGGDYIVASMQIPGRRVWEVDENSSVIIHREKGMRNICKDDIVVFNFPYSRDKEHMSLNNDLFYCKRCVALPGENYQWSWKQKAYHIYLPQAGEKLSINTENYNDYRKCIEYETGHSLTRQDNRIFLADSLIRTYRFRHNYYFMRGDNTNDSYDSRFWGLLPDDFILGVGQFIWFSKDPSNDKIRWNRMFRKL